MVKIRIGEDTARNRGILPGTIHMIQIQLIFILVNKTVISARVKLSCGLKLPSGKPVMTPFALRAAMAP